LPAPYTYGFIGDSITRLVVLALPSASVRTWLPAGLELGEQNFTPTGTHPAIILSHRFIHCQFSFPTPFRSLNYHEQTVGVPFTYLRTGDGMADSLGPYYFMPKLYLDDFFVLAGSIPWGFNKELASVNVTADHYTVTSTSGRRLASLAWSGESSHRVVRGYTEFEPVRLMLSQLLITAFPAPIRPFFALTDFYRRWSLAKVRPLHTVLELEPSYMPGFNGVRHTAFGPSKSTDLSALGSFELLAPWWLSLPYPALLPYAESSFGSGSVSFPQH
jgi:hypothetical protein